MKTVIEEIEFVGGKPLPNFYSCRLRPPGDFQEGSFRTTTRRHDGKQYGVIMGRLDGETTMTEQAYRYSKETWDTGAARSHCRGHDGSFEETTSTRTSRTASGLKTFDADGRSWLLLWTMNAFEDREDETFETRAIEEYVERHEDETVKCTYQFWHIPGTKFGDVLWQGTAGRFLAELGTFDDTEVGQAFKGFLQKHPDGHPAVAPHGWGASHCYLYETKDGESGTYHWFEKLESTVLPSHEAANLWNPKLEVLMNDKQKKALATIGEETGIGGEELVKLVLNAGETKTRELEGGGVAFKMFDGVVRGLNEVIEQLEDVDAKAALGALADKIKEQLESPAPETEGEEVTEGDTDGDGTEQQTNGPETPLPELAGDAGDIETSTKALTHNSKLADREPSWGTVNKTRLPRNAHARTGEADAKSTWGFPHHWVQGGGGLDEDGVYTTGDMYLHRGGLISAWGAAQGARAGVEASAAVKGHLNTHRKAVGLEEASFNESGRIVGLLESSEKALDGDRAPLYLYVKLIEPGWGNERDNHYYPAEVLERDAHVFEGAKMYTTDHRDKAVGNEVSIVEKAPVLFTETGAPIGLVCIYDPNFAEVTRNRAAAGHLGTLECSILATGIVQPGYKADGREGSLVEAIKGDPKPDVDWVTRAGAGGRALETVDNSAETAESEVTNLNETEIKERLDATKLPDEAKEWLMESEYADDSALAAAVEKAVERVKALTGSGKVFANDPAPPETGSGMTKEEYDEAYRTQIAEVYGLTKTVKEQ